MSRPEGIAVAALVGLLALSLGAGCYNSLVEFPPPNDLATSDLARAMHPDLGAALDGSAMDALATDDALSSD